MHHSQPHGCRVGGPIPPWERRADLAGLPRGGGDGSPTRGKLADDAESIDTARRPRALSRDCVARIGLLEGMDPLLVVLRTRLPDVLPEVAIQRDTPVPSPVEGWRERPAQFVHRPFGLACVAEYARRG